LSSKRHAPGRFYAAPEAGQPHYNHPKKLLTFVFSKKSHFFFVERLIF